MQLGDLSDLFDGIAGISFQCYPSDYSTRPSDDMEGYVDLVLLLVALWRASNECWKKMDSTNRE